MGTVTERAREARTELAGSVAYAYEGPRDCGEARWANVSRAGGAITLGRYLRPGREVTLSFESPLVSSGPLSVRARIVWCRPAGHSGEFEAGLAIYRDTPEMALDFAAMGYAARKQVNKGTDAPVSKPVWPGFEAVMETPQLAAQARCAHAV